MKTNKKACYDNISYTVVKNSFRKLCDPLLHMFNLSTLSGIFPDSLKTGIVAPIYKASDSSDLGNWRPISVHLCFSKIFERIMYNRIYKYFSLKFETSAIWLVETACTFLIFLIATVQISLEFETHQRGAGYTKSLNLN